MFFSERIHIVPYPEAYHESEKHTSLPIPISLPFLNYKSKIMITYSIGKDERKWIHNGWGVLETQKTEYVH